MAINVRKGNAHSLAQTDFTGSLKASEGVIAGHLVYKNSNGEIELVNKLDNATRASAGNKIGNSALIGFAVTTQDEGDAIESGKIGVYALDGGSVIETSFVSGITGLTASDVGKPVVQDTSAGSDGYVSVSTDSAITTSAERIIGTVYDIPRIIYVGQTAVTMLPIKLKS